MLRLHLNNENKSAISMPAISVSTVTVPVVHHHSWHQQHCHWPKVETAVSMGFVAVGMLYIYSVQHRQEIGGDICLTTLKTKETFVL